MGRITYEDKVGLVPKTTRKNQVWDDDMNDIKTAINDNYRYIDGFFVPTATNGRQTWADDDRFMGWVGDRYVAGKVLDATGLSMPADIDDTNKIALAVDNEI